MTAKKVAAAKGRPREFDTERALDAALQVFWQKGYEGASLSDLTAAMGVNRPSLYAAFGDKEELFRRVLDRYAEGPGAYFYQAMKAKTAREVAQALMRGASDLLCAGGHPRGCLFVQSALACGEGVESVQQELEQRRSKGEAALRRRLQRAKAEGDLPAGADPVALASYLVTILHGMAVQAASGASHVALRRIGETAMQAWPR